MSAALFIPSFEAHLSMGPKASLRPSPQPTQGAARAVRYSFPGKATHHVAPGSSSSTCGRVGVSFSTDVLAKVDCRQCRVILRKRLQAAP